MLDSDLRPIEAYRSTHYRVHDTLETVTLRIGEPSAALLAIHARSGVSSSAFVTAWNPGSKSLSPEENRAAQQALCSEIEGLGLASLEGEGVDPTGGWPAEASCLILGIDRQRAEQLGRRFRQFAIVFATAECIPELILL